MQTDGTVDTIMWSFQVGIFISNGEFLLFMLFSPHAGLGRVRFGRGIFSFLAFFHVWQLGKVSCGRGISSFLAFFHVWQALKKAQA
jgi:hypothetical protein